MDATAVETPPAPPPPAVKTSDAAGPGAPTETMSATSDAPPPPVNAAAASAASLMTSTAMTPTTTNYSGLNAQLAKATGTLTPLGEDKVSTAGPSATQKAKQSKKKAAGDGDNAKKPSPRVRVKADPNKAEKRKASPARANNAGGGATPTGSTPLAPHAPNTQMNAPQGAPTATPANQPYAQMWENPAGLQQELPPSQDTELRKQFLQRIYRQLQMTHRNQDDSVVRRLATNIEIDICRRAPTRNDYVTLMSQQIHGLMQAELTNGTVGLPSSVYVPGQAVATSSTGVGTPSTGGIVPPGAQTPSSSAFNQPSPAVAGPSDGTSRASASGQGSFMSLLSSQAPMQPFESGRTPQQFHQAAMPQIRPPQYAHAPNVQGYPNQGQTMPQPGVSRDVQGDPANNQQQPYANQRPQVQPNPMTAPPEFVAQFQRLERNALVDLLWTQHKTVIQYQRRLAQLEIQLNSRQGGPGMTPTNTTATPQGVPNGFYNPISAQPASTSVSPGLSAEAEAQRARDRMNSRAQHPPGQYVHPQNPSPQPPSVPSGGSNPALYWDRVRYLKENYLRALYIAHQALSQHSASANSSQGTKAENVKHNITLACSILSEPPSAGQTRPVEVLDSIEKFIISTVVPIVRRVNPPGQMQSTPTTPDSVNGHGQYTRPQPAPGNTLDPTRQVMGVQATSGPAVPPSSLAFGIPNGAQNVPAAAIAPSPGNTKVAVKASSKGSKSSAKKSPANGTKKTTTPKTAASKSTPKGGKKSLGKANGVKQAVTPHVAASSDGTKMESESAKTSDAPETHLSQAAPATENPVKEPEAGDLPNKTDGMADEDLNDFSDFADLDFDDDLQDPLTKASNKENSSEVNSRKRSIEDV